MTLLSDSSEPKVLDPLEYVVFLATLLVTMFLTVLVVGCTDGNQADEIKSDRVEVEAQTMSNEITEIIVSDSADFRDDFRRAIESGDNRFVGVWGYALEVPGVPDYDELYSESNGVKVIAGTSDNFEVMGDDAYHNTFSRNYARGYNSLLLSHLEGEAQ